MKDLNTSLEIYNRNSVLVPIIKLHIINMGKNTYVTDTYVMTSSENMAKSCDITHMICSILALH